MQIYELLWHLINNIPSADEILSEIIESKKGEIIVDLLSLYKKNNIDDYERIQRGEILDKDFKNLGFDFHSLRLNILNILMNENHVFRDKDKIINSSKNILFEGWGS